MREKPGISEERLRACLREQYGLFPDTLEFLSLGLDYNAGVYRVVSEQGGRESSYLLKVKSGPLYEPGCLVPRYLKDQGISSVVAPLRTRSNSLWTQVGVWSVIVYPFLEGVSSWTGMTDEHWQELGAIFKQIHQVRLPAQGFEFLRKETFDPAEYARWVRAFEAEQVHSEGGSEARRALRYTWVAHQSTIHTAVASLEKLAGTLQRRSGPYVICHADLHPVNLIRDRDGHVFVIDWDDVKLAPRERDFIFIRASRAGSSDLQASLAFFQGYGPTEIDWTALTYYRWERVVQDVIECAYSVFFRDGWEEETRAEAARLFEDIVAGGGTLDAAYAAATHIPPEMD